jgi:transcription elongation factor GreA
MNKTYQITKEGKVELENELEQLKGRRGEIAEKIAEARDYGDLSENAEYDAAREEQGIVETRIVEIEDILLNAQIIQGASKDGKVSLGTTVDLETEDKKVSYTVVGPVEADPLAGKISNESPIGEALIGKVIGDKVVIKTPKAETEYTIKAIR